MKNLITSLIVASAFILSATANASSYKTDSERLAECKASINAQFDGVEKIKVATLTSRRNAFKAKLRVTVDGERSMVLCEIAGEQPVALSCANGRACLVDALASK